MNRTEEGAYWQVVWDKFKAGDRRAFETIYNEFADALFSYGSRLTNHRALVEDAIQDLFLDVYKYGTRLYKPESLEFYLYKTLRRIIIRKLKEKYRFTHPDQFTQQFDLKFPLEEMPSEFLEEQFEMLQKELVNLDAKKRELLFLKFNSGLTYPEMGALLDCKPDTVKKQVTRLLKYLQVRLKNHIIGLLIVIRKENAIE
jgi:RNA polymerase sigma factor (sigma-70 family)